MRGQVGQESYAQVGVSSGSGGSPNGGGAATLGPSVAGGGGGVAKVGQKARMGAGESRGG
eukprot:7273112-Lingulodinium_polyedra.AAC.1